MTDHWQRQQLLLNDAVSPHSPSDITPTPTYGPCKCSKMGMAHAHATINVLTDDIFLEILAFHLCATRDDLREAWTCDPEPPQMREWQRLAHVCQRWRQIIYTSPRYLGLFLYCSNRRHPTRVGKNLSCWPAAFPIAMNYHLPDDEAEVEAEVIALLRHSDRLRIIRIITPQVEKVVAAMQGPFPLLTELELRTESRNPNHASFLCIGFLGGYAPCLQQLNLSRIAFPALPTLLLSARDLVSLQLEQIPLTGYISPEAMVASLPVLTRLESLFIHFSPPTLHPEQRTRRPDRPMRAVLPTLTKFHFNGHSEYLEDFVAQIDAPRLIVVGAYLIPSRLDCLSLPQLFLFIDRTNLKNLKFRRLILALRDGGHYGLEIDLQVNPPGFDNADGEPVPHFYLHTALELPGTHHVAHLSHVLTQIFTMPVCSNLDYLSMYALDDHPGWRDYVDSTEWLALFRLFPTVKTLHIFGRMDEQVGRALEDVPEEMVTEVLPSLHSLILENPYSRYLVSTGEFVSLRKLYGCPVVRL